MPKLPCIIIIGLICLVFFLIFIAFKKPSNKLKLLKLAKLSTPNWMGQLAEIVPGFKSRLVNQITMPGMHDSQTYAGCKLAQSGCRTQTVDYHKAMINGIRYFDARFSFTTYSCTNSSCNDCYTFDTSVKNICETSVTCDEPSAATCNLTKVAWENAARHMEGYHAVLAAYATLFDLMGSLKAFMETPNNKEVIVVQLRLNNASFNTLYISAELNNKIVNSIVTHFINYIGPNYFVKPRNGLTYKDVAGKILLLYMAETGMAAPTNIKLTVSAPKASIANGPDNLLWDAAYQGSPEHRTPESVYEFLKTYYSTGTAPNGNNFANKEALFVMQAITMWSSPTNPPDLIQNGTYINDFFTTKLPPPPKSRHNIIMMDAFDTELSRNYIDKIIYLNE